TDIRAQIAGVPIHALFGKPLRSTVRVYSNINRVTGERSPAGYAKSAKSEAAKGYTAIKNAPVDGVYRTQLRPGGGKQRPAHGIDCVLGARDGIGPDVDLLIDCHWRFDETTACQVIKALEPAKLYWAECLVSESPENQAALARVTAYAAEHGVRHVAAE